MGAKLIRDKMDSLPWKVEAAKVGLRSVASPEEHATLLVSKFLEESGEFLAAIALDEMAGELADVIEVGISQILIAAANQVGRQDVVNYVLGRLQDKYAARGGFCEGLVWET